MPPQRPIALVLFSSAPVLFIATLLAFSINPNAVTKNLPTFKDNVVVQFMFGDELENLTPEERQNREISAVLQPPHFDILIPLKYRLAALDDFYEKKLIQKADVESEKEKEIVAAVKELDDPRIIISPHLLNSVNIGDVTGTSAKPGIWARAAGLVTMINIVWVCATVILGIAFRNIIVYFIRPFIILCKKLYALLKKVPKNVYEVMAYIACALNILYADFADPVLKPYIALPGAIGAIPCLIFSATIHLTPTGDRDPFIKLIHQYSIIVWGILAIQFQSLFYGFIVMGIMESYFGFYVFAGDTFVVMGWDDRKDVVRGTYASAVILWLFVIIRITGWAPEYLLFPFQKGAIFVGAFVYYIGLTIMGSRYWSYNERYDGEWLAANILFIISTVLSMFLGTVYGMDALTGIAGTFGMIWVLAKYIEAALDMGTKGFFSFGLLGVGAILWVGALFFQSHPQYIVSLAGRM